MEKLTQETLCKSYALLVQASYAHTLQQNGVSLRKQTAHRLMQFSYVSLCYQGSNHTG